MGQATKHRAVIRRNSSEENTFAVVQWTGKPQGSNYDLIDRLRAAVDDWMKTDDGREAFENSGGGFNIGDLANESLLAHPLVDALAKYGLHNVEIEVFSDARPPLGFDFDTRLG